MSTSFDVAFIVPAQGPTGMYGPSCAACAILAVEELNQRGGLLGRQLRLRTVDGGRAPQEVADEVDALITSGAVEAVTGWHISAVRQEVARRTNGRVPYVYAPLYEGGERTPGVFLAGETPSGQVVPAMSWLERELGVRSWYVIGDDYIWPRKTAAVVALHASARGTRVAHQQFVPLGTSDFRAALENIESCAGDGVLMLLVGADAVQFNRAFAAAGLAEHIVRLCPTMEENVLLASGSAATTNCYAAAGYFESLNTTASMDFAKRYYGRFGPAPPALNTMGESCYEAIYMLAQLVHRARGTNVRALMRAASGLAYESPRGTVRMQANQLRQTVYLAAANGLSFEIQDRLTVV